MGCSIGALFQIVRDASIFQRFPALTTGVFFVELCP